MMNKWCWRLALLVCGCLFAVAAHAQGRLYMVDDDTLWIVDHHTADRTEVGPGECDALAPSPQPHVYLYCAVSLDEAGGELFRLDLDGSGLTLLTHIYGDADRGLAYNSKTGVLYGTDNVSFGSINPVTGVVTPLADPPDEPEALAADPNRNLVYGLDEDKYLVAYDAVLDSWDTIGPTSVDSEGKGGMAYDPVGDAIYFITRYGDLFRINPEDGGTESIGAVDELEEFRGMAFVPFPARGIPSLTFWGAMGLILLAGLSGLAFLQKRKVTN